MSRRNTTRVAMSYSMITEWTRDGVGNICSDYVSPGQALGAVLKMDVHFNAEDDPRESFAALFTDSFVAQLRKQSRGAPLYIVLRDTGVRQYVRAFVREVFTRCGDLFPKVFC